MNERIRELEERCWEELGEEEGLYPVFNTKKFAELIVKECAKELREAEQEADRAYKAKEVKERNTFDGYDFAAMLEERFGVEE